jgi:hypothetical protein
VPWGSHGFCPIVRCSSHWPRPPPWRMQRAGGSGSRTARRCSTLPTSPSEAPACPSSLRWCYAVSPSCSRHCVRRVVGARTKIERSRQSAPRATTGLHRARRLAPPGGRGRRWAGSAHTTRLTDAGQPATGDGSASTRATGCERRHSTTYDIGHDVDDHRINSIIHRTYVVLT